MEKIILFVSILVFSYNLIKYMYEVKVLEKVNKYITNKTEEYYDDYIKKSEKSQRADLKERFNIVYKINLMIERAGISRGVFINPISLILYGLICFSLAYDMFFNFFKVSILSLMVSIPFGFLPFGIINIIASSKNEKLEKVFLNFLLQLKNYTKINNDITGAFKQVETIEPLQSYINKFNIEINSGVKFEKAIEHIKEKISINKFKEFFSNVQYCYLYGGNFAELIDRNYDIISELQKEKNKRKQETKGARISLYILIFLDLYMYLTYINSNYDNYLIMQKSFLGTAILYWNFGSMLLLMLLASKVKKLDY